MTKTEPEILTDVYEKVRSLSKMFISPLKDIDIYRQLEINKVKFNSAYWIVAHLAWTEHSLLVQGIGNQDMKIEWIDEFAFGTNPDEIKSKPSYEEVLKKLDEVHLKAVGIIRNLSRAQLEEENHIGASFGGSKNKRNVIIHAIRHEPMHIGQLSWILKSNGIKFT
jgi:DinB superfamily